MNNKLLYCFFFPALYLRFYAYIIASSLLFSPAQLSPHQPPTPTYSHVMRSWQGKCVWKLFVRLIVFSLHWYSNHSKIWFYNPTRKTLHCSPHKTILRIYRLILGFMESFTKILFSSFFYIFRIRHFWRTTNQLFLIMETDIITCFFVHGFIWTLFSRQISLIRRITYFFHSLK